MATATARPTAPKKVKLEDIDLVLRDAEVCNVQLYYFHRLLNEPDVDETRGAEIESKCSTIFRDMMSHLYSVLDQIYYFLHCHYQNNGDVSLKNDAWQIKQPIKQDLKWSLDNTRDQQPECKKKRNDWVTDQCTKIFGNYNFPESKRSDVRHFQNGLLQLQAIKKVDSSGGEVLTADKGPTLLRAVDIQHDAAGNILQFNPSNVPFEELKSVKNRADWNDTINFNLLHFFRNFTAHRSLIECKIKKGYWNLDTGEFKPTDHDLPEPWIAIAKGAWILVPELSHLRQVGRDSFPCYPQPLTFVCNSLLDFVKWQRSEVLRVLNAEDYRYEVGRFDDGSVTFKENGKLIGKCQWKMAHLWPGVKTL